MRCVRGTTSACCPMPAVPALPIRVQGSWRQVEAGMNSFSTVIGYPLALAAAATLVLAVGILLVLLVQTLRGKRPPHHDDEGMVE